MSQSFEGAQPQVVRGKHKYRGTKDGMMYPPIPEEQEGPAALNIMYDKRVFRGNTHNQAILKSNLTPAQKEEQRIKEEREKKKIEMIKAQLMEFKKSKNTTSPYDLRPGPPARIEVDLTYFLTEQGKSKPEEAEVKLQTDQFQPKPPTPQYVPKKTGIDKITQIEDYDLFNYDEEVQPILNVLLSKSIDQATLEVEEEHELEEIRKFKYEYHKRREMDDQEWQSEVKREIQRIKIKNKALDNARIKRKQQIETMNKLQCLNIAKNFLSNNFMKSMQFMADKNHWRDSFQDQLQVNYKEWMLNSVTQNLENKAKSAVFKDNIAKEQITKIGSEKDPIKKHVKISLEKKEKFRVIESQHKRIVHFLFDSGIKSKESSFARKYKRFLEGPEQLEEFEAADKEKFDAYVQRMINEEPEEGETNPIIYEEMPYFHFELSGGINRICFSTADDPFYKLPANRYYPECVVYNQMGEQIALVNPKYKKNDEYKLNFQDDFRDSALRINDDCKIQIPLNEIKTPGTMILLLVRQRDLKGQPPVAEDAFDRSWFRISNEDTNQTLDYSLVKNIEVSEEYKEFIDDEENEDAPQKRNALTYVHGRLVLEDNGKWVFESYQHVFEEKDHPDIAAEFGNLYGRSCKEVNDQKKQIQNAERKLQRNIEEKKLQAQEAMKKAKAKGKKKGKADEDESQVKEDITPISNKGPGDEEYDLTDLTSFRKCLGDKIKRPFIFGPVEFEGLDQKEEQAPFDYQGQRDMVTNVLEKSLFMPAGVCIYGFNVMVKDRRLKRRSSLLKHARFLKNLQATPVPPPVKEEPKEEQSGSDNE